MPRAPLPLDSDEISRDATSPREGGLRSRAAKMLKGSDLLHGAPIARERSCGCQGCRCERGEKHPLLSVYRQQGGKLRQLPVGRPRETDVRRWIAQDEPPRTLLEGLREIRRQRAEVRGGDELQSVLAAHHTPLRRVLSGKARRVPDPDVIGRSHRRILTSSSGPRRPGGT